MYFYNTYFIKRKINLANAFFNALSSYLTAKNKMIFQKIIIFLKLWTISYFLKYSVLNWIQLKLKYWVRVLINKKNPPNLQTNSQSTLSFSTKYACTSTWLHEYYLQLNGRLWLKVWNKSVQFLFFYYMYCKPSLGCLEFPFWLAVYWRSCYLL